MTVKINTENRNKKRRIDLSKVDKLAEIVLKALKKDGAELNIVFFSSQKIRVLNRTYLNTDAATDVIAFPFRGGRHAAGERRRGHIRGKASAGPRMFLGDIAISSDRAARNAGIYGTTFTDEIALYVIHGILHLAGYEDATPRGRTFMRRKENEFLRKAREFL